MASLKKAKKPEKKEVCPTFIAHQDQNSFPRTGRSVMKKTRSKNDAVFSKQKHEFQKTRHFSFQTRCSLEGTVLLRRSQNAQLAQSRRLPPFAALLCDLI